MQNQNHKKLSANPKAMQILIDCTQQGMSDKQIQQQLMKGCGYQWSLDSIGKRRRSISASKQLHKDDVPDNLILTMPPPGLTEVEKAGWFRDQLKKTHLYKTIKKQFAPDEVAVYLEDFGLLCCQFEDIVISEFMQIDDFLKHRILIDRQLILSHSIQQEIADLQAWLAANPKRENESKETIQFRVSQQHLLEDQYKHLEVSSKRYDELVKERQKIYASLAATRKDRLTELKGGKATFLELVGKLQHFESERDKQGRFAELTRMASNDIKKEFRKPVEFPDGSYEPIILDAETDLEGDNDE